MREFLTSCGAILRYHDMPGDGTPILFIHGLGSACSLDYPTAAASPQISGHRRLLVDLLGFGYSDWASADQYALAQQARHIAAMVQSLGIARLHIFGHSMGGAVAIALADLIRERVAGLIVAEGNLDGGGGSTSRAVGAQSAEEYRAHGHARMVAAERAAGNTAWAMSLHHSDPGAVHAAALDLIRGGAPSWRELLYRFPFPKAYIFGERSLPDPDVDELARHGVRVGIVPYAGHDMAVDNPVGLAEAVAAAIR